MHKRAEPQAPLTCFHSMNRYTIITPATFIGSHYRAVVHLLGQLTTRPVAFTEDDYRHLIASANSRLLLLCSDDAVIGMLTIGLYYSPTGSKAWIEDVVVDNAYRGQGLGRMLVAEAIGQAREWGAQTLMLTSNPKRIVANALYRSLGFEPKETNVYRMVL